MFHSKQRPFAALRRAALTCALAAAGAAQAQTAPAPAPSAPETPAQQDVPSLPQTIVTANRVRQPLTDGLADLTLIVAKQIQDSGAINIADLLQRQPGFELSRTGGTGLASSLYVRGGENRFTAVYIDGVRVDTQATGGPPWEAISLDQVDRIEIVRGPAAAVYGSDAISGVVQIFTKKGEGPFTPYAGVGVGNRHTGKMEAGFSGQNGVVDYALGASRDVSRGFASQPAVSSEPDGYGQTSASGRLGVQMNADQRLDLTGSFNRIKADYANAFALDPEALSDSRLSTLGAVWSAQWTPNYSTRVSASQSQHRYDDVPSGYQAETTLQNYLLQNEWRQGPHLVTLALERREDHLEDDPIAQSRHQDGLALGYGYTGGPHTLQVNLRHDRDSEFGGRTTGGIAYGYSLASGWRVTGAVGSAFRVPTLYQRFSDYGNPMLQPEKSYNTELGLHWAQTGSSLGLTAYRNRVSNLISFGAAGPCGSPYGCYVNTGRATLRGVTLTAAHQFGPVHLGGSLDLQDPRDDATDNLLARRARRILKLNADTRVSGWTLGAEWQVSGRRYDDAANTVPLGGYGLVNLYASTTIARDWTVLARIDNLAGKNYQLASGYATLGRSFYAGLRWSPSR